MTIRRNELNIINVPRGQTFEMIATVDCEIQVTELHPVTEMEPPHESIRQAMHHAQFETGHDYADIEIWLQTVEPRCPECDCLEYWHEGDVRQPDTLLHKCKECETIW